MIIAKDLQGRYEAPQTRVRDILFENCILSDQTVIGNGGEDADDEMEPGF